MLKSIFSFMLIGTLLFSSNPIANIMANKATDDEARSQSVDLEEVFVSESGMLADAEDGEYVGIPAKAFEPRQTFEGITIDDSNKMKDVDGEEIGTYSDQLSGKVSEEELAAPRALLHLRGTDDSAQQDIELNDFRAVVRSGAVLNADGDYVWTAPNSNKDHAFTYRIIFSTSGTGEFAPGQIQITVPKTILYDRNGEYADAYDVAVPEENEEGLTVDNPFVYRVAGDNIVIYNCLGYSMTGKTNYIEVTYRTSKSTFEYADYKSTTSANPNPKAGSDPFQASIEINRGDVHLSGESASVPVYIDTTANLTKAVKKTPTPYESWNSSWGEEVKPDDPEDYYYLIWEINTELTANQPCDLICNDTFNEHDAELLGYSGARNNFMASGTFNDVRANKTIYVLTAHNKAVYDGILENDLSFTLKNNVKMTLRPVDLVDAASVQTAAAQYKKETARFEVPHYNFFHDTWGYDSADRYYYKSVNNGDTTTWNNTNSDYIRDYSLTEFSEDRSATIDNLKYFTVSGGRPYKFTIPDGVSEAQAAQDPARYYGQNPVKYHLTNRDYYIKEISEANYSGKLSANDYELQKLELRYKFETATYNEETKSFVSHNLTSFSSSDIITVYAELNCNGKFIRIADYDLSTKGMTFTDAANNIVDIGRSSGITLNFKSNVTGYRLETTNAYWYTEMGAYSYVRLKHSQTVDSYVRKAIKGNDVTKLALKDSSDSVVYVSNSPVCPLNRYTADFITGKVKKSELRKSYAGSTNNKKNKEYTVTWSTSASETYTDNEGTHASPQGSGVFYDLLPDGAAFKNDSLKVYAGSTVLDPWKYTVTVDDNYKGSGRTLLTVRINQPGDNYRFVYSTIHPWDAFVDFGKVLRNTVAYETGNLSIANGKTKDDTSDIYESALMKNLDPSAGSSKRFLYTQSTYTADFPVYAELGLEKKVKSENDPSYSNSARVYSKDSYSYNVRFATDDKTKAKDLIAFDSLENYTVGSGTSAERSSDWHGVFRGIDTHYLTSIGIAPKIYYSTTPELIIKDENENIDNTNLSDRNIWTPSDSFTGDLSTVKAIAVDMRKTPNGSDYVLGPDKSVQFNVFMTAPNGTESAEMYPKAFNGVYLNNNIIDVDSDIESGEMLIHQEYTEVTMTVSADLELLKVCREDNNTVVPDAVFELKGTSDYGTVVDETLCTDSNGRISRKNLEKGTYTLKEIKSTNDFFINDTEFTVVIDKNGTLTINGVTGVDPFVIEDPRRVHGKFEFLKRGKIDGTTDTVLLDNAKFKLEGTSDYGNPIILYGTSQDGGVVTFPDVEKGIYELTETHADGYITFKEKYRVVCDEYGVVTLQHFEDGAWAEVTDIENGYPVILNEPLHSLRLVKYDEINNKLLGGAEFNLKGTSAYGTPIDITKTSDTVDSKDGVVLFEDLEPGTYTLRETKAPAHYQLDPTVRTVNITSNGEVTVTGLEKMQDDWQGGYYTDYFGVPNTRAYEGEITITKRWLDEDGNRITDSSDLPIPVVHIDTSEPVIYLPPEDAYLHKSKFRNFLSSATTFQQTTLTKPPVGAVKVDDGTTRASIYAWKEGNNAYWWTDAVKAHLPNDCSALFDGKNSLTDIDLSGFDTSNVTNMRNMFKIGRPPTSDGLIIHTDGVDSVLKTVNVSGWDTSNVTDMSNMFYYNEKLTSIVGDISNWDTGKVTDMSGMFENCNSLTSLDLNGWYTGNVTSMHGMFWNCYSLTSLDLGDKFDTGKVTDMSGMFRRNSKLTSLDLSGWDTGKVTDMSYMFYECANLTRLDLSSFNTGNVTDMSSMFHYCYKLTSLDLGDNFDTGNVTDMSYMFYNCSALTSLDLSGWNTGNVTDMYDMFGFCRALTTLDLSSFNTGKVTTMAYMFNYCDKLTSLDLSSFNTGNVTNMKSMFDDAYSLKTVYVSERWSTAIVTNSYNMFYCPSLAGGAGTTFNWGNPRDKTYARIDDPSNNKPGYFTYKAYVPPTVNKDDEPVGATLNNVLGGLINKLVSAVFGDSSAENSQAAPEIQTVKKPEMLAAGTPIVPTALQLKSDGALGAGDGTDTNTVTFSQTTNSVMYDGTGSTDGKWRDNGDGTWTYRMKVFDADAKYYVWEEPIPGFKCNLVEGTGTGYTVIDYPKKKNATITNTRTTTNTCSLTLKKVLEGNASDYPEYDLAGMDYHFNVKLTGAGVAGEKIFGYTKFTDGKATVTLKAGEQMTFTNIPRGVTYTVTEQEENYQGIFDTTYSPSDTLTEDNSDVTFTVTNNIKPKKSFDITKHVLRYDNGELDAEDLDRVFTFNVDLDEDINGLFGDLIFTGGTATAYLKHDETVSITGLPNEVESYTVTEVKNSLYTCDHLTQSGTLTVGKTAHVVFNNKKIPETERDTGSFTLKKTVNGKSTDAKFSFNVSMQNLDKNAVYPLSDGTSFTSDINGSANLTIQLAHGDSVKFSDLPVGAEYTVSEQACGYYASYTISGTDRVTPLTDKNTVTDKQLTTSKITVQKDDDITIAYTNTDKRYDVRIAKVDEDDEFVTDAVLQIIEKGNEENVLDEWVTTEDYHTAQIPQGTYILREKQAPFGYMKAPDIEFTVNADGTITSGGENVLMLKMVDKPVNLAVTGAGGVIPVAVSASISFVILLAAVVIKNRKNNIKEKRSTTK